MINNHIPSRRLKEPEKCKEDVCDRAAFDNIHTENNKVTKIMNTLRTQLCLNVFNKRTNSV